MGSSEFSRRSFLKGTAAAGAMMSLGSLTTGSLVKSAHAQTSKGVEIIRTCCRNCTADCGVLAHVRDGRVLKIEGDPEFERSEGTLCPKGLSGIQALYNPNRTKYPMKRVGARGENKWQRVSWDQAIDEIAQKLMDIRAKYGAETVFASTGGGGNPNFYTPARFCNVFGTPNWFEPGAAQCYMPRTLMYALGYGLYGTLQGQNTSLGDSNCVEAFFHQEGLKMGSLVLWGTAPSYSGPSQGGRVLAEVRAQGVKTVVVDPRFTPDAAKADVWLPIRPGTDVALGLSWIRYIIAKKLYDKDFMQRWSNMPYLVDTKTKLMLRESDVVAGGSKDNYMVWDSKTNSAKPLPYPYDENLSPALEGTYAVNGRECKTGLQMLKERADEWTLEKAGEECALDPKQIEKAILIYAKEGNPSSVALGVATDQNPNSAQTAQMSVILHVLMGYFEKPGVQLQRYDDKGLTGRLRTSKLKKFLPDEQLRKRIGITEHKGALQWWTVPAAKIIETLKTKQPYQLRAWLERSGNKLGVVGGANEWIEAMKELELIVHIFMYPTSFSAYADYLLPVHEWLETDFLTNSMNRAWVRQATTHLYETVNEAWVFAKLAKRCGELGHENCKRAFDPKETAPELPYFDTYEEQLDAWCEQGFGMTYKEYREKIPFEYISMDKFRRYYVYKEINPKTGKPKGFGTQTGKVEGYMESVIHLGRTGAPFVPKELGLKPVEKDYDPLPYYIRPAESPLNDASKDFPLTMTNGRLPYYHHGTLRNVPYLRELQPVAEIWVHPVDCKTYGVTSGDWVWVESKRGKIQAKVLETKGVAKHVVYMERFWNPETLDSKTHGMEMNVNVLTKNTYPHNDLCGTYTLRGFQVKIYKADGAPEGIWQKPEEFEAWMPAPSNPTKRVEI